MAADGGGVLLDLVGGAGARDDGRDNRRRVAEMQRGFGCEDAADFCAEGEVVPEEEEIYVTLDDGQRLELYFTDSTELVADGQPVDFSRLSAGMSVQLTVTREGNRNVPIRVEIEP